jgi:hypothetical protein
MTDEEYWVSGEIYNVKRAICGVPDEEWYEYRVELVKNGEVISSFDSRLETYNGVEGQRLSKSGAKEAVKQIKEEVKREQENTEYFEVDS